ncbi:uncharacterized protein [Miscanthus floridulus]|uniref:uncharacterized protein n=1 Tax=Miscanthus floridulus TaxID=154761 RepID=UPI00345818DA
MEHRWQFDAKHKGFVARQAPLLTDALGFRPFVERLRAIWWPVGFKVLGVNTYDGKANPTQWLTLYEITVRAVSGDEDVIANYLPIMLNQSVNNWLLSLWENSIQSWDDLEKVFTDNYMATCEQPDTKYDLEKLHQSSKESLHDFIRCFSEIINFVPNITDAEAIAAFTKGLWHKKLHGKLYRKRPTTIGELIQTSNEYADSKEAKQAARSTHHQHYDDDRHEDRRYDDRDRRHDDHDRRQDDREPQHDDCPDSLRGRQGHHRQPGNSINTINARAKRTYDADFGNLLDSRCPIHKDAKHTMQECRGLKIALGGESSKKP